MYNNTDNKEYRYTFSSIGDVNSVLKAYNLLWNYAVNVSNSTVDRVFDIDIPNNIESTTDFINLLLKRLIIDEADLMQLTAKYRDIKTLNLRDSSVLGAIFGVKLVKYTAEYDKLLCLIFSIILLESETELYDVWDDFEEDEDNMLNDKKHEFKDIFNIDDKNTVKFPPYAMVKGEVNIKKAKKALYSRKKLDEAKQTTSLDERSNILTELLSQNNIEIPKIKNTRL